MFGACFVIQYLVHVWFFNHLDGEERADGFILTVFLMSCDIHCFFGSSPRRRALVCGV